MGIGIPNPIDVVGDLVGGVASTAAEGAMNLILAFWYGMIADAVAAVTNHLIAALDHSTAVSLTSGWWTSAENQTVWRHVLGISAGLLLLFYLLEVIKSVATGDTAGLLRTIALTLPTTVLGTLALVAVTTAIIASTDEATLLVTGDLGSNLGEFSGLLGTADALAASGFLGLLFALLYVLGAVFIWIQMVIRASLIYVLVMFAPLALAARVFEGSRHVSRRLIEVGIALILSKFAIGLTLATGAAAVAGGSTIGPEAGTGVDYTALIAGPAIMILGAFMPFVLYRLIPAFEGAAVGQGIASGPIRAISTVGGLAFAAHTIGRLAGGGSAGSAGRTAGGGGGAGGAGGGAAAGGAAAATGGGAAVLAAGTKAAGAASSAVQTAAAAPAQAAGGGSRNGASAGTGVRSERPTGIAPGGPNTPPGAR